MNRRLFIKTAGNKMLSYNPTANASWAKTVNGVFHLDDDYYTKSGGIFAQSEHYKDWFDIK